MSMEPSPTPSGQPEPAGADATALTFTAGGESYAVAVTAVHEIIGLPPLARLPGCAPHWLGVMNLRGMVLPVVDLRLMLGLTPPQSEPVVVVLSVGGKLLGAVVDAVSDVAEIKDPQPAPESAPHLTHLAAVEGRMVRLMDPARLLGPELGLPA